MSEADVVLQSELDTVVGQPSPVVQRTNCTRVAGKPYREYEELAWRLVMEFGEAVYCLGVSQEGEEMPYVVRESAASEWEKTHCLFRRDVAWANSLT